MPPPDRARFDPLAYRDPRPFPALIRVLGPVNRHLFLRRVLGLAEIRLPDADLARLRGAVHPGSVAFLGPAHPEFMTDWLIDKEISRRLSPLMAHWASWEIVNASPLAQRFWLANNLIANVPGGGGRAFSLRWAKAGHGVLLHPEGTASWQGERVGPLLPGIVELAHEAARELAAAGDARPVWIVPIVWKLTFRADVALPLAREIATIERALSLPRAGGALESRFASVASTLLRRQCAALGLPAPDAGGAGYFAAQDAAIAAIRAQLEAAHGPLDADAARAQHQLRRAVRALAQRHPAAAGRDRALAQELGRLAAFDPALYGRSTLTQEQIAECLKRTRGALLTRGFRNALHNTVPVAVAPRTARIHAPEPIRVHASAANDEAARAAQLGELRARLQAGLDRLAAQAAPEVDPWRRPNPLAVNG